MSVLPPLPHLAWAAAGGALGAAFRLCVSYAFQQSARFAAWSPYAGTLVVNVLGCFAIGWLLGSLTQAATSGTFVGNHSGRAFLIVGVLGGFTTFSAFGYETFTLLQESPLKALVLAGSHLFLGLAAVVVGSKLA